MVYRTREPNNVIQFLNQSWEIDIRHTVHHTFYNPLLQYASNALLHIGLLRRTTSVHHSLTFGMKYACEKLLMMSNRVHTVSGLYPGL